MKFVLLATLLLVTTSAFANKLSSIVCFSENKTVYIIKENGVFTYANYEIDGVLNDGADVNVEDGALITDKNLAISLSVDGQKNKIKIDVETRPSGFPNVYYGSMIFGKQTADSICVRK